MHDGINLGAQAETQPSRALVKKLLATLDLSYVVKKMVADDYPLPRWSHQDAKYLLTLYKRFLWLCYKYPSESLVPSKDIDEFWHNHILHTREYTRDCQLIFGHYLHHSPSEPGKAGEEQLQNYARTKELYLREFGERLKVFLCSQKTIPDPLLPWVQAKGSITQKAVGLGLKAQVSLLNSRWHSEVLYEREIVMLCNDSPWWYARTEIPKSTYIKKAKMWDNLGENSLGCVLFSDPTIERVHLSFKQVDKAEPLYRQAAIHDNLSGHALWARFSEFDVDGAPLYLTEVFLPSMIAYLC